MKTTRMVLISLFAALTAILAQISISVPFGPVPFTLSILAVFLSGALLEPREAALSQWVYLLLGGVGLPVFAGFSGGLSTLVGPTGGYLLAYPVMAWLLSTVAEKTGKQRFWGLLEGMLCALAVCYLLGTCWLALSTGVDFRAALMSGVLPFVAFDLCKAAIGAGVGVLLHRSVKAALHSQRP